MNYNNLIAKQQYIQENIHLLPPEVISKYESTFAVEYTHNSTAIEGNTLTLMETKLLLEDQISIGGKSLREIHEVINHSKAFSYVKQALRSSKELDENIVKDLHAILMENIMVGGVYRSVDVYISGAQHTPPSPNDAYRQIKAFYDDLPVRYNNNVIELAAWTHAEFVRIHPFVDGNGRVSRLLMNYQLMANGFLPISIPKEQRLPYYEALEEYAVHRQFESFVNLVAEIEDNQLDKYITVIQQVKSLGNELER